MDFLKNDNFENKEKLNPFSQKNIKIKIKFFLQFRFFYDLFGKKYGYFCRKLHVFKIFF